MKYPIGIQSFEDLRRKDYVYVDKTGYVYKLASTGKYYFLSRPRRFGKSLLLSTMKAYFSGKKELFKGLALEQWEHDWTAYPILHLDLNTGKYASEDLLNAVIHQRLSLWEKEYGAEESETTLSGRFLGIIRRAYEKTGKQVVILIDEYDKPLLQAIDDEALQDKFRNTLKAFYSVLKTQDAYIKFAFLTGVTKFGKVSVFSDLNNLKDISMDNRYVEICGITEKEVHAYFEESIKELAESAGMTYNGACAKLKEQYNGYHFRENSVGIYNPFSLLNAFDSREFGNYWFETGTPSFLVHLLKQSDYNLNNMQKEMLSADVLNSIDSLSRNPIPVIYQSGYLTIVEYNERFKKYRLDFPNREVKEGFTAYLLPFYTPNKKDNTGFSVETFVEDVESGNVKGFMTRLQAMFAGSDYRIAGEMEIYFQNTMYVIFMMMGIYTEVERATSRGRMDIVLKTDDYIYVMELKLDGSAEEALRQIEEKGYAAPFAMDSRKLYKIGVNFSSRIRGISEWKMAE